MVMKIEMKNLKNVICRRNRIETIVVVDRGFNSCHPLFTQITFNNNAVFTTQWSNIGNRTNSHKIQIFTIELA